MALSDFWIVNESFGTVEILNPPYAIKNCPNQ